MFEHLGFVMSRGWGPPQCDSSLSPVNTQVVPCQPGVSKNAVVLFTQVHCKEALDGVLLINPNMEVDLVTDHSSLIIGPVSISSVYGVSEPLQRPIHPLGEVKVDATDCFPTVS